ncbi:MAG: hypothetical protein IJV38_00415 [Prevotella sp.]|nr:hypothetical protein [Prevotella sp.]
MKHIKIQHLLGAVAMTALLLTGCAKDNSMTDITPVKEQSTDDANEVIQALSAVEGITDVELQFSNDDKDSIYSFYFVQPIDHHHPENGTYKQQVSMKFVDYDQDVVLYTHGYAMPTSDDKFFDVDLRKHLKANLVKVEHRYFGLSLPGALGDLDYTFLDAEQQSHDLHNIVQALRQHFFKTGKWVSTGTSKDGITSALYAYYSDLNGWKDIDVFVPFCAPFMPGTTENGVFSCMDSSPGIYLTQVCGSGYPEGSDEAVAAKRIKQFYNAICTNKTVRNACIQTVGLVATGSYRKILEQYNNYSPNSTGNLTKDLTALVYNHISDSFFRFFSYVPFSDWATLVPDPVKAATDEDELENLTNFISLSLDALADSVSTLKSGKEEQSITRSSNNNYKRLWEYLNELRYDSAVPYEIHAFKELGYADLDYSLADGTFLTAQQIQSVIFILCPQYKYQSLYPQDKGTLMRSFRQWVYTENTQPIIFVYAKNDPWTGARPDDAAIQQNPMTKMIIDPIATHNHSFLDRESYTEVSKQAIISALNTYLGTAAK